MSLHNIVENIIKNRNCLKIFAFFGVDVEGFNDNHFFTLNKQGYTFLALDSVAIERISRLNLPYTIIHDWLDVPDILQIQDSAWNCEINWFQEFREEFTYNGICWPEIDHMAMHWFWLEVLLSDRIVTIFRKNNIKNFLIISQNVSNLVFWDTSGSICKEIWKNEFENCITIIDKKTETFTNLKNNNENVFSKFNQFIYSPPEILKEKIAYCIGSNIEITRSTQIIQDLKRNFPNEIVFIPIFVSEKDICKIVNQWKIPILAPVVDLIDKNLEDLKQKFSNGFQNSLKSSNNTIWRKYFSILNFYFLHFCQFRWPILNNFYVKYCDIFTHNKPKILINSVLNFAEWSIPVLAAKQVMIPTLSMPHGVLFDPSKRFLSSDLIHQYDFYLTNNLLSKEIVKLNCVLPDKKIRGCNNCIDTNEYIVKKKSHYFSRHKFSILILFNPVMMYQGRLIYSTKNARIQIETLELFEKLSQKYSDSVEIKYKVHPGYPELELFYAANIPVEQKILPINSETESVLEETDLIFGVNYYGSALIQVLKNKKPFINYINDEPYMLSYQKESEAPKIFDSFIKSLYSPAEIIQCLDRLISDPSLLCQIIKKEEEFSKRYLNDSSYPSFSQIIKDIID